MLSLVRGLESGVRSLILRVIVCCHNVLPILVVSDVHDHGSQVRHQCGYAISGYNRNTPLTLSILLLFLCGSLTAEHYL